MRYGHCHCPWLLVLIAFTAAACANTNALNVDGASVNTNSDTRGVDVDGVGVMNITNTAGGNRTSAPESVNTETFIRDSLGLGLGLRNMSNNVLNEETETATLAKVNFNTNETVKIDNNRQHSAVGGPSSGRPVPVPSPKSNVNSDADADTEAFNVFQLKEPFGTVNANYANAKLDDYSYREIIEDWASSILMPNRTRTRTRMSGDSNSLITTDTTTMTASDRGSSNFNETTTAAAAAGVHKRKSTCKDARGAWA